MSTPVLSQGSTVIVTVFRPTQQSRGIGTTRLLAQSPIGAPVLTDAIAAKLPGLFVDAALPELLLPGAPLIMLLQTILPDGQLLASSCTAMLNRAAHRAEMLEAWKQDMPSIVSAFLKIVGKTDVLSGEESTASEEVH